MGGNLPPRYSFIEIPNGVIIECIKRNEDGRGVVIRLHEVEGRERTVEFKIPECCDLFELDLLENIVEKIASNTNAISLHFKPFEIKTILLSK